MEKYLYKDFVREEFGDADLFCADHVPDSLGRDAMGEWAESGW